MTGEDIVKSFETVAGTLREGFLTELRGVRTNRPSPQLIERVTVNYAGTNLTVREIGTISVQLPRDIVVTVWDKAMAAAVAKAIQDASLGFTPSTDGNVVRMQLPPLTDERRAEYEKLIRGFAEKTRIRLRAERDDANKRIARAADEKLVNEDQKFKLKAAVQKAVDKVNGEIEEALTKKIQEIRS